MYKSYLYRLCNYVRMYVCKQHDYYHISVHCIPYINFVYKLLFLKNLAINTCFNESSMSISEDQGSLIFSILLTNPSSTDIIMRIVSTNGAAIGMYVAILSHRCNMGGSNLPDMYVCKSPRKNVHISRQITSTYIHILYVIM